MILVQLKRSLQLALRLSSFGGEKNSLKAPLQWKSCAHLSITAVLWAVPDSLGAFTTEQLSLKAQLCCFFRAVSGETENLMATLAFCLPRTAALREKWAKALLFSLLSHCCSFFFFIIAVFFPLRFMLGNRTGHLHPSTRSALLSDVVCCSTVCWFGFFFQFLSQMCNDGSGSHTPASLSQPAEHLSRGGMQRLLSALRQFLCHKHRG